MPWWVRRIYREGLEAEAPWIGRTVQLEKVEDPLSLAKGLFSDNLFGDDETVEDGDISDFVDIRPAGSAVLLPDAL